MSIQSWFVHSASHSASSMFAPVTRAINCATNTAWPTEVPDIGTLLELYQRQWISEEALRQYARCQGVRLDVKGVDSFGPFQAGFNQLNRVWKAALDARQEFPPPGQLFVLANRGVIKDDSLDWYLGKHGFSDEKTRERFKNLRYEVPGPSDLVRFAVRHVFEPDLVKHFGYPDERDKGPFLLDVFHQAAGINYPIFTGPLADTVKMVTGKPGTQIAELYAKEGLPEPTWADAYWWAHWVLPSPSQGYEMLFRLRPDRNKQFDPPSAAGEDFSSEDLNLLLRANDYPPFYRNKLASIAYRIPGIRFLRQLRATDVFKQDDVKELLLRQGYSDGDAGVLALAVERNDRDQRRRSVETQAKGQLAKYWETGIITDDVYQELLVKHGLTPGDAADTVKLARLDLEFKRVTKIVDFVHKQFLAGAITDEEASTQLRQIGVTNERTGDYIQDWQMQLKTRHKEISAEKNVQWACKGFITVDDLRRRLANLGYLPKDIDGLVAEAVLCQATLAGKAAAQAARLQAASQRQLRQQQREAAQAIIAARRQLASHGTPAQLRKWFCEGSLGQTEVYTRLRLLGWPDEDITRMISDCKTSGKAGGGG